MQNNYAVYSTYNDIYGNTIVLSWEQLNDFSIIDQNQMLELFVVAFLTQYRNDKVRGELSNEEIEQELINYFTKYIMPRFQSNEIQYLLCARNELDGKIIGFIFWEQISEEEFYVAEMAITPSYWQQGLGRNLMGSIFDLKPHVKRIALITERDNLSAKAFYEAIGYHPSKYMHADYSPDKYCGYELLTN